MFHFADAQILLVLSDWFLLHDFDARLIMLNFWLDRKSSMISQNALLSASSNTRIHQMGNVYWFLLWTMPELCLESHQHAGHNIIRSLKRVPSWEPHKRNWLRYASSRFIKSLPFVKICFHVSHITSVLSSKSKSCSTYLSNLKKKWPDRFNIFHMPWQLCCWLY